MPKFSGRSRAKLSTCHKDLQTLLLEVVREFDCRVTCGHRDKATQNELHSQNRTQVRWPKSRHNSSPSMAVDVAPYPIDWQDRERFHYFAGYVLGTADRLQQIGAISHRVRWGGDWDRDYQVKDNNFDDLVHFELVQS